ncbi:MAG TPA: NUDIX hydrolase [Tepidiformaceae bacterium]|nr:NUDIX hydrolase [Tepidiformaceae bacterium]
MPELPRVLSSETVYRGRLFNVELDRLAMDGGVIAERETLRHPGAVCMIPILQDARLVFVTQYRHPTGRRLLELPAGTLEKGEQPAAAAVRELQEEIGYRPTHCEALGGFFVAPGYTSEYIHLFACTDLEPGRLPGDEDEDIEVEMLTVEAALSAIESGDICDAKSVIGVLRWSRRINR